MTNDPTTPPKTVTVICTTPWGPRHEMEVSVLVYSKQLGYIAVELPNGWSADLPTNGNRVVVQKWFTYELGPNWRQEIGDA